MSVNVTQWIRQSVSLGHGQYTQDSRIPRKGIALADFIQANAKRIAGEWESFARTLTPAANDMTPLALRDHIEEILAFIVSDITSPETDSEQTQKAHGGKERTSTTSAADTHAALRLAGGFDIGQMVSEYRALRASVVKLWRKDNSQMNSADIIDLTRFNESIDQELAETVSRYTQNVRYSKDLLVGTLSHDLRSPLNVISMSAQLLLNSQTADKRKPVLATQIAESAFRITRIVNDLLDVTRARFGSGLPVIRATMDMGSVSQHMVDEIRAVNPTRTIRLEVSGDARGEWDKARIGQVLSNLIGNAVQYSFRDSPIDVTVQGASEEVVLSVHNQGVSIPPDAFGTMFAPLNHAITDEGDHPMEVNLGLGLFITEEIVVSHGGTIDVTSSEENGTTFTARFPRLA